MSSPSNRPTGTVTFLFIDTEGSSTPSDANPVAMQVASARRETILRGAIEANSGYAYKKIGNAFQVAFHTAPQAVQAALQAQRDIHSEGDEARVRMALHSGVTEERGDDYVGPLLNRVARLLAAGYGGQVLLTLATAELVRDNLPEGAGLKDLGEHRLKDLFRPERVYQLVAPDLPSDFPPLKTLEARPNNLPLQPTPFVGRDREVQEVRDILRREGVQLLTLTGPGGIGKTRLALQAAADLLDEFPDGVFFVPLAAITDSTLVLSTIAHTLEVKEAAGQPLLDVLGEYLRHKRLLLVLDNFEQLLGLKPNSLEAAMVVAELLAGAPQMKVLVTSRASLRLSVEQQYPVPALSLPPMDAGHFPSVEGLSQYEAVALFISRAQLANPWFEVNNQNAPAVAEICVRLDGLPLAIELAAARIKILPPHEILQRLSSRLKLLTGGGRDLPARQQTLRGAIEWSHDLLDEAEKQLFRRLAVFVGGSTLEAIEMVCNTEGKLEIDVLDGVSSLVDKSLVAQQEGAGGEPRFVMLETMREFAREKLQESSVPSGDGDVQALEEQHARYFLRLAEEAEPELRGANAQMWLNRIEEEHNNIRAALHWAKKRGLEKENGDTNAVGALEMGLRAAGAMWRFWDTRGYHNEGRAQLASLLELDLPHETAEQSQPSAISHQPAPVIPATAASSISAARAIAFNGAANLASSQGDYTTSRSLNEQSLALRREIGDKRGIAASLNNLGLLAHRLGDYPAARSFHEQSLAIKEELGDRWGMASSFNNLGLVVHQLGDFAQARSFYEQSLALHREHGDRERIAGLLNSLASLAADQDDYNLARSLCEESLAVQRELGDKRGMSISLDNLGVLACLQGNYTSAISYIEESLALGREIGSKSGIAFSLSNLGLVAFMQEDYPTARSFYIESLMLRQEMGSKAGIATSLIYLGALAVRVGQTAQGSRVLGAAREIMESIGMVADMETRIIHDPAVAAARAQLGEEAFERECQEGRAMSIDEAIEYALKVI